MKRAIGKICFLKIKHVSLLLGNNKATLVIRVHYRKTEEIYSSHRKSSSTVV